MKKKIQKYEVQAGNMWGGKKREKKEKKMKSQKVGGFVRMRIERWLAFSPKTL